MDLILIEYSQYILLIFLCIATLYFLFIRDSKRTTRWCHYTKTNLHIESFLPGRWYEIAAKDSLTSSMLRKNSTSLTFGRVIDGQMDMMGNSYTDETFFNGRLIRSRGTCDITGINEFSLAFDLRSIFGLKVVFDVIAKADDESWIITAPRYAHVNTVYLWSRYRVLDGPRLQKALQVVQSLGIRLQDFKASVQQKKKSNMYLLQTFRRYGVVSEVMSHPPTSIVTPYVFDTPFYDKYEKSHSKFWTACMQDDASLIFEFLEREPLWMEAHDRDGWTCIHYAAFNGRSDLCSYLIAKIAALNYRTSNSETALHLAVIGYFLHLRSLTDYVPVSHPRYSAKPHSLQQFELTMQMLDNSGANIDSNRYKGDSSMVELVQDLSNGLHGLKETTADSLERVKKIAYMHRHHNIHHVRDYYVRSVFVFMVRWLRTLKLMLASSKEILMGGIFLSWVLFVVLFYWMFLRGLAKICSFFMSKNAATKFMDKIVGDLALLVVLAIDNPTVHKVAQLISCRPDLVRPSITSRFEFLRDNVPVLGPNHVLEVLHHEYGEDYSRIFREFDLIPFASGTVGQVHRAVLSEKNTVVAVKLIRPAVRHQLNTALKLLHRLLFVSPSYKASIFLKRLRYVSTMIFCQSDMLLEAASMSVISKIAMIDDDDMWAHKPRVPTVNSMQSTRNILIMEYVHDALPFDLFQQVQVPGKILASRIGQFHLACVLLHGIFHCDIHPGNLMFHKVSGKFVLLDYGLVGELRERDRIQLCMFFLAVFGSDMDAAFEILCTYFFERVRDDVVVDVAEFKEEIIGLLEQHFVTNDWVVYNWIQDSNRILQKYHLFTTSNWANVELSILTLQGTLKILDPEYSFSKLLKQFMSVRYRDIYETIERMDGSESRAKETLFTKFGWAAMMDM